MGKIVHGINAPAAVGAVVCGMAYAIQHRVSQIHIGRSHVNAGAQNMGAVQVQALPHFGKQAQTLLRAARPVRARRARRSEGAAPAPSRLRIQAAHVGAVTANQLSGKFVQVFKVVGSRPLRLFPPVAQPADITPNCLLKFRHLRLRVSVVKTQPATPAILLG